MATEYFSVVHTAGKTVYFRFMDPSDGTVFDFDDDAWEVNLAACTTPKLAATERTDLGDADESTYVAGTDLTDMYNTAAAKQFVVQAVDDLATDEVIATAGFLVSSGTRVTDAIVPDAAGVVAGLLGTLETHGDEEWAGGDATAANQEAILAAVAAGAPIGAGADSVTLTLQEGDESPIADADVWITTDAAGATVVAGTSQTNSVGEVTFMLDAGLTYYRWAQKDGYNFDNPQEFVAVADE